MEKENNIDNIADWTAYKMRSLVADQASAGRLDLANALQDALDAYLMGQIHITFKDGKPYVTDITE
tara:strand:+ start:3282 stop:3479 length:198 start_codon:yes stop_codon:yes gene_type:complete